MSQKKPYLPKSLFQLFLIWLATMLGFRLLSLAQYLPYGRDLAPFLQASLLIYLPLWIFYRQKRPLPILETSSQIFLQSLKTFCLLSLAIFPLLQLGNHFFQDLAFGHHFAPQDKWFELAQFSFYHLLAVALPEEIFFRGFFQEELHRLWKGKPWRLLGAQLGPAWLVSSLIFAFSHSLMSLQWWHFAIFFPALAFGWLKEKTGHLTASILFHALSNAYAQWVFWNYS